MDKITLGINIDGLSVQAALVRYSQGLIVIEQLDSFKLFDSLEQSSAEIDKSKKTNDIQIDDSDNPFGMDINVSHQPTSDVAQARGNVDVIIELLSKMSPFGCPIAFNLQNSNVFYKSFQIDNTTKPSKIRKFIWEEFNESNEGFANLQNIDFIRHNNGTCLGVIHNDPLIFSNLLQQAIKLTKRPQSPIHLIYTIEFALSEYLCRTIGISAQDRLSVIYFSQNFTKIFFMN